LEKIKYHIILADYFRNKADPFSDASWKGFSTHALIELPYQIFYSEESTKYSISELFTDVLYLNARTSSCNIWQLLDDYSDLIVDSDEEIENYRSFVLKHAQTLVSHDGQLVALLHHEGFPQAKTQVKLVQSNGLFTNAWFHTWKKNKKTPAGNDLQTKSLELFSVFEFELSYLTDLAPTTQMAFHLISLGTIGIIDLQKNNSLNSIISIRRIRPLGLFSSNDGQYLAIALENGEADIIKLDWNNREIIKQSNVVTLKYYVPQFEAPTMYWQGHRLIFQNNEQRIMSFDVYLEELLCFIIPGNSNFPVELRAVTELNNDLILAISSSRHTQILHVVKGNSSQIYHIENVDIISLCKCDFITVAATFTNRMIMIFCINGTTNNITTTINEMPVCMACDNNSLTIVTDTNNFYIWKFAERGEPVILQSPETNYISKIPRQLALLKDGVLISVSQSEAATFKITTGNVKNRYSVLSLVETVSKYYAVIKRESNLLLVELSSGNEIMLIKFSSRTIRFCTDGLDNLLYVCSDGTGFIMNITSQSSCHISGIPSTMASVTGDPNGGFWIADRLGDIQHIETNGSIHLVWSSKSKNARVQELLSTNALLVWRGWLDDQAVSEEARPDTLLFFETNHSNHLQMVGQRVFRKPEGFIESITYNGSLQTFVVILGNSANGKRGIRVGSAEDFIEQNERFIAVSWLPNRIKSATCKTGSNLYLLSEDGCIYCLDTRTFERKAGLSPSLPFQSMSTGWGQKDRILLADGKSDIYLCRILNNII